MEKLVELPRLAVTQSTAIFEAIPAWSDEAEANAAPTGCVPQLLPLATLPSPGRDLTESGHSPYAKSAAAPAISSDLWTEDSGAGQKR